MAIRVQAQAQVGGTRAMDARAANDRIADKAEQLRFVSRVPMLCECSSPACRSIVMISLADYRNIRQDPAQLLVAPGHAAHTGPIRTTANYEIRRPEASSPGEDRCA
jgi:hypothetical protein